MLYSMRNFRPDDAAAIVQLRRSAITHVGRTAYADDQVEAWLARVGGSDDLLARANAGDLIFVAADPDSDNPVAYALLQQDGHVDHLYCHPDHTRRGLADQLLQISENKARNLGIERLFTEASELAKSAFARAGYAMTQRHDFEIGGVAIHNYAMEKRISPLNIS